MKHSTGKIGLFPLMPALAMAALFTACGDEITEVTQVNESAGIEVLAAGDTLGDCAKDNAGEMLFVTDSSAVYYCADGKWQTLNGIDGKPGENGNDGKPGENGKNGLSCSATQNGDETTITCETADGKPVSYVVKNGENGKSAYELSGTDMPLEQWLASLKGDNGLSCSATQNGGETTITCETANGDVSYEVANGMSTYEIAVQAGFQGSEAEWLESLKGDKGDDGVGCEVSRNGYELTITCANSKEVVDLRDFIVEADPDVTPGTVPGANSSSSEEDAAAIKSDGYYSNSSNCPAGLVCKYATTTEYLNSTKTYGEFLDTRDGQVYKTVEICDKDNKNCQTWMAQNLNYAYTGVKYNYRGYTSDSTSWCGGGSGTTAGDCSIYGRLYTWAAAVDSVAIYEKYGEECGYGKSCTRFSSSALATAPVRGVCPSGWHLPRDVEWSALYTNVGGTDYAGRKLKANTSLWSSNTGTDDYGFSVLPAGSRNGNGDFSDRDSYFANFWSSTEYYDNSIDAWNQRFYYSYDVSPSNYNKPNGFSVRCLKD